MIYVHHNPIKEYFTALDSLSVRNNRLTKAVMAAADDVDVHPDLLSKVKVAKVGGVDFLLDRSTYLAAFSLVTG